jgi:hypothetical protein
MKSTTTIMAGTMSTATIAGKKHEQLRLKAGAKGRPL